MADEKFVEVRTVATELERELVRSALEPYGIEVLFRSFLPSSVYPGLTSIKVLVPEKDLELARRVLSETDREPNTQI
ncbi:MAG TPA: DUF2007 domain-containing protein [Firmicutes bacterium]|nr:DUF2007 domain-containing protein [Candidatus Fermentithermobacillaceae bacterium]